MSCTCGNHDAAEPQDATEVPLATAEPQQADTSEPLDGDNGPGDEKAEPRAAAEAPLAPEAELTLNLSPTVADVFRDVFTLISQGHTVKIRAANRQV